MQETNEIESVIYGESLQGIILAPDHLIPMTIMVWKSDQTDQGILYSDGYSDGGSWDGYYDGHSVRCQKE